MNKKEWNQPALEELSIQMTLTGSPDTFVDAAYSDNNQTVHLHGPVGVS